MNTVMATAAKLVYAHIVKQPGYCGGKAAIDDTRVRVNDVVSSVRRKCSLSERGARRVSAGPIPARRRC